MVKSILNQVQEVFAQLPTETEMDYELELTRLAMEHPGMKVEQALKTILEDEGQEDTFRYAAFYTCVILCRRYIEVDEIRALFSQDRPHFIQHPSLEHLWRCCEILRAPQSLQEHTQPAFQFCQTYSDNSGYSNAFAEIFLCTFESLANRRAREAADFVVRVNHYQEQRLRIETDEKIAQLEGSAGEHAGADQGSARHPDLKCGNHCLFLPVSSA